MGLFNKVRTDGETYDGKGDERRGIIDRIKYDGLADELVWKFPYENLSIGAQLIVNQSQEAIFFKGGAACDIFGPGTHTLSANNIPILQKLVNLPFGGNTPFTAEVWYINKMVRRNLKWGTKTPMKLRDPLWGGGNYSGACLWRVWYSDIGFIAIYYPVGRHTAHNRYR